MKKILWRRWKNPLISSVEDEDNPAEVPQILRHTPFGVTTLKANSESEMAFKMYVGHTNFDLTDEILNVIEDTEGVEILEHFSPYQFRISVGRCFSSRRVREAIRAKLCDRPAKQYKFEEKVEREIASKLTELEILNIPYLVYILPNGKYEAFSSKDEKLVISELAKYENIKSTIGGILLSNM